LEGKREGGRKEGKEGGRKEGRKRGRKGAYRVGCLAECGHEATLDVFKEQEGEAALVLGIVHHAKVDEGGGGGGGGGGLALAASAAVNDVMEDVLVVDDRHFLPTEATDGLIGGIYVLLNMHAPEANEAGESEQIRYRRP